MLNVTPPQMRRAAKARIGRARDAPSTVNSSGSIAWTRSKNANPTRIRLTSSLSLRARFLDALVKITTFDPTLAYRRSCREGVCVLSR